MPFKNPEDRKKYLEGYNAENKEMLSLYKKSWYEKNKEMVLKQKKEHYSSNKEKILNYAKKYYQKNREQKIKYAVEWVKIPENRIKSRKYHKKWEKDNSDFIISQRVRAVIKYRLKNQGIKEIESTSKYGIDINMIVEHLNKKAKSIGYSINDILNTDYDIDHIIPMSYYSLPEEIKKCYHPLNLRWLPSSENRSRGNKLREEDIKLIKNLPIEIYPVGFNIKEVA